MENSDEELEALLRQLKAKASQENSNLGKFPSSNDGSNSISKFSQNFGESSENYSSREFFEKRRNDGSLSSSSSSKSNNSKANEKRKTQISNSSQSLTDIIKKVKARNELNKKGNKSKTKQESYITSEKFFHSKKFCFIPFGMSLIKKRIEIMTELVKKKGGLVFPISSLPDIPPNDIMIITSKDITSLDMIKKLLPKNLINPQDYLYLDCEWISKCMIANKLVDYHPYRLLNSMKDKESLTKEDSNKGLFISKVLPPTTGNVIISQQGTGLITPSDESPNKGVKNNNLSPMNTIIIDDDDDDEIDYNDKDDEIEYLTRKSLQSSIDKAKTKNKRKNHVDDRYLYDYLDETQILKGKDHKEEINQQQTTKTSNNHKPPTEFFTDQHSNIPITPTNKKKQKLLPTNEPNIQSIILNEEKDKINQDLNNRSIIIIDDTEHLKKAKDFQIDAPYHKKEVENWMKKKSTFLCQADSTKNDLNEHLTKEFEKLLKVYTNQNDKGRMLAYRKAIATLRTQKKKIECVEEVKDLPGIGKKIKEKIVEILTTGKLKKAELLMSDEKTRSIEDLSRVWGIGVETASKLYQKGIKTIEDLRKNQLLLNENQRIGLKYLEEFELRIPRDEVNEIVDFVKEKIEELADIKGIYEAICCGSYRRGKPTCGDIDILIARKDDNPFEGFLSKLVKSLEGILLTDHLALPIKPGSHGSETYMGVCSYKGSPHRRIDIKIYPRDQYGYALLFFTGSNWFNRSMRLWARKLGYTLGDHGLYPVIRTGSERVWTGQNIPCYTEEDVFKVLNLDYKRPEERDIG